MITATAFDVTVSMSSAAIFFDIIVFMIADAVYNLKQKAVLYFFIYFLWV